MSSLHAKLFQEAQKICKWKMTMEFELRQRDDLEKDQKRTIDAQRQSLLNLQLDNENLSQKMQEEMHKQKELTEKNTNTRELCNAVKNYSTKVNASVNKTNTQCEETKQVYMAMKAQMEKLHDEFSNLHITTQKAAKDMISKLEGERQEKEKILKMHKSKIMEKDQEFEELWKKASQQEEELNSTVSQLQTYEDKCNQLGDIKDKFQQLLEEAMCKVQSVNAHLAETKAALESTKAEKDNIEGDLVTAQIALEKVMHEKEKELLEFDQKEKSLQLQQKQLESTKIDLEEKLSDCTKTLEDLKNGYADLLINSQQCIEEHDKLKKENDMRKGELDDTLAKKQCLWEKLQECIANRDSARKEMTSLLTKLDAEREKAKTLSEQCAHSQLEKDELNEQIDLAHNQVQKIEHLLEESKYNEAAALEDVEKMKVTLEQKIMEFQNKNEKREEELSHEKAECEQSKQKQLQIVEKKLSATKEQLDRKTTLWKDTQQEVKKLQCEVKQLQKKNDAFMKEVDGLTKMHSTLSERLSHQQQEHKETEQKLQQEVQKMSETAQAAQKVKAEVEALSQHRINEMIAMMEDYKLEYDKMVHEKDGEISSIRSKEYKALSEVQESSNEMLKLKQQLKENCEQSKAAMLEKENMLKKEEELRNLVKKLEDDGKQKEVKVMELNNKLGQYKFTEPCTPLVKQHSLPMNQHTPLAKEQSMLVEHSPHVKQNTPLVTQHTPLRQPRALSASKIPDTCTSTPKRKEILHKDPPLSTEENLKKKRKINLDRDSMSDTSWGFEFEEEAIQPTPALHQHQTTHPSQATEPISMIYEKSTYNILSRHGGGNMKDITSKKIRRRTAMTQKESELDIFDKLFAEDKMAMSLKSPKKLQKGKKLRPSKSKTSYVPTTFLVCNPRKNSRPPIDWFDKNDVFTFRPED
uniref:synaptonemal complex protein 1-like n=3 Tax=Myxine glutinosa TaxID=7769 RepID=UPI00358FDF99